MKPGGSMPHSQGSPIIHILSRINTIPRIDTYYLKLILIWSSHLRLGCPRGLFPVALLAKTLKALIPFSISCPSQSSRLNHLDYIPQYEMKIIMAKKIILR